MTVRQRPISPPDTPSRAANSILNHRHPCVRCLADQVSAVRPSGVYRHTGPDGHPDGYTQPDGTGRNRTRRTPKPDNSRKPQGPTLSAAAAPPGPSRECTPSRVRRRAVLDTFSRAYRSRQQVITGTSTHNKPGVSYCFDGCFAGAMHQGRQPARTAPRPLSGAGPSGVWGPCGYADARNLARFRAASIVKSHRVKSPCRVKPRLLTRGASDAPEVRAR